MINFILEMNSTNEIIQVKLKDETQLKKCTCINDNFNTNRKEKTSFKQIFHDFSCNTTAHGFAQIVETTNIFLKVIWITVMVGCVILLITQVIPLLEKYASKPTSTKISIVAEREIVFPVVVICNENPIKSESLNELLEILELNGIYIDDTFSSRDSFEYLLAGIIASMSENSTMYGHPREETIQECFYKYNVECNKSQFWNVFWHWKYGTCLAFNSGYDNNGKKQELLKVKKIGPYNGLELTVFLNQSQYLNITKSAGVTLFIGNPGVHFAIMTEGFKLSPGFSYSIGITKTVIKRTDPFNNGSCVQDKTIQLSSNVVGQREITKYNQYFCDLLCLAETQVETCGCIEFWIPRIKKYNNVTVCLDQQYTCSSNMLNDWLDGLAKCTSMCMPPCHEIKHNIHMSMQQYPTMLNKEIGLSTDYLKILVYFKTMQHEMVVDTTFYNIENLLGDIGGQMGLFIGCSVLTLIEFISLFVYIATYIARSCRI